MRYIWLAVTADKFELPIAVADSAKKLANMLGINENTVYTSIHSKLSGKNSKRKIIRVDIKEKQ